MAKTKRDKQVSIEMRGGFFLDAVIQPKRRGGLRARTDRPRVNVTADYVRSLPLTDRDRQIVRYLGEIGYATTTQLFRLFFHDLAHPEKEAQRRLLKLWLWHVLDRMPGSGLPKYGLRHELVYSPGKAGVLMLDEQDPEGSRWRKRRGTALMCHNVLLSQVLVGLADTATSLGWTWSFYGERTASAQFEEKGHTVKMRPDGVLFVSRDGTNYHRAIFLEMDTSMRELNSLKQKVLHYDMYMTSEAWNTRYPRFPDVWFIFWAAAAGGLDCSAERSREHQARNRLNLVASYLRAWRSLKGLNWLLAEWNDAAAGRVTMMDDGWNWRQTDLFPGGFTGS